MIEEKNAARRDWYEERSDGSLDFPYFLSAARRLALEVRRVSEIHGLGGEARAGLETRTERVKCRGERGKKQNQWGD